MPAARRRMNLPIYWDPVVMAVWSLIIYALAIRIRHPEEKVNR